MVGLGEKLAEIWKMIKPGIQTSVVVKEGAPYTPDAFYAGAEAEILESRRQGSPGRKNADAKIEEERAYAIGAQIEQEKAGGSQRVEESKGNLAIIHAEEVKFAREERERAQRLALEHAMTDEESTIFHALRGDAARRSYLNSLAKKRGW